MVSKKLVQRFKTLIAKAQNIVITTHLHPDADGIGSQIALCMALRQLKKNVFCVNSMPLLPRYRYLDPEHSVLGLEDFEKKNSKLPVDLFIIVDTNLVNRVGAGIQQIAERANHFLMIDHHPCPKEVKVLHCIDTKMAATGELVGALIHSLGIKFTKPMALALYTAIIIDTSSFRYPTVSGHTHHLVGKLMETGIRPPEAFNFINGTKKITHMQLLGRILSNSQVSPSGKIAWLTVTKELLSEYKIDPEDTHSFINHLLILDNVLIACMFKEEGHSVKIGLRSTGDVDVGVMAQALGGGGHNHSAATVIEGKLDVVVKRAINDLEIMLKEQLNGVQPQPL